VLELDGFVDIKVVDHGYRSVTGVEHPLDLNRASLGALAALPGIGAKRAARIVRARPFHSKRELISALDDEEVAKEILEYTQIV
jgi:radical SAM superfamily enzyme with C-terminal helix-hairpin-helix motif